MALNPLAAEFVPYAQKWQQIKIYTGWGRDGFSTRASKIGTCTLAATGEEEFSLTDVPKEVNSCTKLPWALPTTEVAPPNS